MNMNEKNIGEEILENVSGGIPVGRNGKPVNYGEYKKQKDGIHVTSATFGPEDDGIHVTTGTF